jgi:hypothetical protein
MIDKEVNKIKRKKRSRRVNKLEYFDLEEGKLYNFNGNYRSIYNDNNIFQTNIIGKLRRNHSFIFIKGFAFRNNIVKTTRVFIDRQEAKLTNLKKKNKILSVEKSSTSKKIFNITYKSKSPTFSGMFYIGYGDKFGWINIVQMTKEEIQEQFSRIDISTIK